MTLSAPRGRSRSKFLRLCCRAPRMRMAAAPAPPAALDEAGSITKTRDLGRRPRSGWMNRNYIMRRQRYAARADGSGRESDAREQNADGPPILERAAQEIWGTA